MPYAIIYIVIRRDFLSLFLEEQQKHKASLAALKPCPPLRLTPHVVGLPYAHVTEKGMFNKKWSDFDICQSDAAE